MPKTPRARPNGAPIAFEEIPPPLRPQVVDAYLCLLDEGYAPQRISFRDHGDFVRVQGLDSDGRPGTSRPADPDRIAPEPAPHEHVPTREERDARRREHEGDLRALIGQRVRIRWPIGHERIGVVRERKIASYRRPQIVLEDDIRLHALEDATALDVLATGRGFQAAETARDWAAAL